MSRDYDVIILGSGPAGFACAMQSSKFGKRALVIEANKKYLGGTWINTGTVPSKALREAAKTIYEFNRRFGDEKEQKPYERFRMKDLLQYKNEILENENRRVKDNLIKNQVDTVRGFGRLLDEHTVEVENHLGDTATYTGDNIMLSTGSIPKEPVNFEIDDDKIFDNQSILELTHIPRRLVIAGAGVNAIEYASTFAAMGTRVTILNDQDDYLTFLDNEIKEELISIFNEQRISIRNNVELEDVDFNPLRVCTEVRFHEIEQPDNPEVLEAEHVLYLGGRQPNTGQIGLEHTSVQIDDKQFIKVDKYYATHAKNIYAGGDVIGFPSLASASFSQGRLAACHMFGIPVEKEPSDIPFGIYSIPELAHIGMTEQDARRQDIDVTIGRAYFKNTTQADINHHHRGLLKLVFETKSLKLLGVHILGERACDIIHIGQAVLAFNGDIRYFIQHVLNYPTYSEAYRNAAFNGINRVNKAGVKYQKILKKDG